jgi:hypothetical protein
MINPSKYFRRLLERIRRRGEKQDVVIIILVLHIGMPGGRPDFPEKIASTSDDYGLKTKWFCRPNNEKTKREWRC